MQLIFVCWFCILQLDWVHLLVLTGFLLVEFWISIYKTMSCANRDNFASFPIQMPFISFSCLLSLARTCSTRSVSLASSLFLHIPMLNKSTESRHSCLGPSLRGKSFQPSIIEYDVGLLCLGFIYVEVRSFVYPVCWEFLLRADVEFCQSVFYIWKMILWFLDSLLLMWYVTFIILHIVDPSLYLRNEFYLIMVYDFSVGCWIWFTSIFAFVLIRDISL